MSPSSGRGSQLLDLTGDLVHEKYRIESRIASGGMGDVYRARHELLGKQFAVKFMKPELASDQDTMTRFFKEAQIAASTRSAHVVDVTDLGFHHDVPFIVMEYLEGVTLEDRIESGQPPDPVESARIMMQVCKTLAKIHELGVIHRDLKPSNLMLVDMDGRSIVKILDFGISLLKTGQEYVRLTSTGAILGTPYYMAPEQARGLKTMDHRVDIYSVGTILFELLAHRPPFMGDSYNMVIIQVATEEPEKLLDINPSIHPELAAIVEKAMAKDPDHRYQNAGEMVDELAAYISRFGLERPSLDAISPPVSNYLTEFDTAERGRPTRKTLRALSFKGTTQGTVQRRRSLKYVAVALMVLLVIGGAAAAALVLAGKGRAPGDGQVAIEPATASAAGATAAGPATPARTSFDLSIETIPTGATVTVDDTIKGTTPVTLDLPPGEVDLQVALEGYAPVTEKLAVHKDDARSFTLVALAPPEEKPAARRPADDEGEKKKKKKKKDPGSTGGDVPKYGGEVD